MTIVRPAGWTRADRVTLARLRERLEQQHHDREAQLRALTAAGAETTLDVVAIAHRASVRRILSETKAALTRMELGRYGICVRCDELIPVDRLELVPHAGHCLRCIRRIALSG